MSYIVFYSSLLIEPEGIETANVMNRSFYRVLLIEPEGIETTLNPTITLRLPLLIEPEGIETTVLVFVLALKRSIN